MKNYNILFCFCLTIALTMAADQKQPTKAPDKQKKEVTDLEGANSHHYPSYKDYHHYPYGLKYDKYDYSYGKFYVPTYDYGKKYDSYYPHYHDYYGYYPWKAGYYPWKADYYPWKAGYYPWKSSYFPYWYGSYYYPPYDYGDKPPHPSGHGYHY
ncbi:hypothetical protein O3M35_003242 [Rhynocoris fuscipes]|uniref:Uncharacterized protein n=1 Tax=Rhynocoris fuscipes TaxID=488301 RepID=A0AAW1CJP8_9HEMI